MRIFIAGSCVTRDAFTPKNNDQFEIAKYSARYSLARLVYSEVSTLPIEKLDNVRSKFQRRLLISDMSNDLLKSISNLDFDKLVIDCVDERFGLIQYLNTYITNSDDFRNARIIKSSEALKISPSSDSFFLSWEEGLRKIIEIVGSEKIIINNVFWSNLLETGHTVSTPERINYCNAIMVKLYSIARKYFSEEQFVNYPREIFVGDSKHKWGKSPFHYTQEVYDYFIHYLQRIK